MTKTFIINRNELEKINYTEEILSEDRKKKNEKVKLDATKQLGTCAELLLIYALRSMNSEIASSLPLNIVEDERKKLQLASENAAPAIHFNFSHAKDYAACTVSDEAVGVDIDYFRVHELMNPDKILHPDENTLLAFVTNPNEKKKYFYECWVSKESYLKNLGIGLLVRPNLFLVNEEKLMIEDKEITSDKPRHKSDDNLHLLERRYVHVFQPGEVRGTDWKFDANYRLAVCTMKKESQLLAKVITAADINAIL